MRTVRRPSLSILWALAMLGAAFVPLAVVGWTALDVLDASITERVRASQEQSAAAARTVLVDRIEDGKRKLLAMARLVGSAEDAPARARTLDRAMDPPDLFLEVGCWTTLPEPRVAVQSQSAAFENVQAKNDMREFDSNVSQRVMRLSNRDPLIQEPRTGNPHVALEPEVLPEACSVAISVPAERDMVLVGSLDLLGLRDVFAGFEAVPGRVLTLQDGAGQTIVASREPRVDSAAESATSSRSSGPDDTIEHQFPAGHSDWTIRVSEPASAAFAPLDRARRGLLVGFGVAIGLCVLLAFGFAGVVVRPVRELVATTERLARGELSARSGLTRSDEIGQLAAALDHMAHELEALDSMKTEFVGHVSHELRTPLTSARLTLANVEEGLAGPEALARVRADIDRLVKLVEELLDLTRVESGLHLETRPQSLGPVVLAAVETVRPLSPVPIAIRSSDSSASDSTGDDSTSPPRIDAARVQQIVVNLVDNAAKHARTRVEVVVGPRSVRVTDDGPGVPPELRERIFEGFVRLEAGRSTQGFGLGLAIARKLARLHGAELACEGNTFVIEFPA